ncbi:hypothetical protein [Bauldia sp.]|uniref:hypothetical protein n=1 Tax=Bauldia sp. TaxID=2575872 RepID=UPI003BA8B1D4
MRAWLGSAYRSASRFTARLFASSKPWLIALSVIVLIAFFWTPIKNLYWRLLPPAGAIYVDSPEVYTRERLINERLTEEAWLDDQLTAAATNEDFTSIENIIRRQLNLDLDQAGAAGGLGGGTTGGAGAEAMARGTSLIGFNDKFRLRSASRSLIRQRIIENKLDDRHDLEGNALYVLKFDNTVISAPASGRMAQVRIEILPPDGVDDAAVHADGDHLTNAFLREIRGSDGRRFEGIYEIWRESISDRVNNRLRVLYSQFLLEPTDSNELFNIRNYADFDQAGPGPLALRAARPETLATMDTLLEPIAEEDRDPYVRRIKAYFARKAIADVLGVAEDEIEIELASQYDPFREYPVASASVPDALGLTVRITSEPIARPLVYVRPRNIQLYVFDEACQARPAEAYLQTIFGVTSGVIEMAEGAAKKIDVFQLDEQDAPLRQEEADLINIVTDAVEQFSSGARTADTGWQMIDYAAIGINNPFFEVSNGCEISYALNLKIGYYDFVRSVVDYNTYSYSVLPREGSLPVVSDISSRYEYSSPGGVFDGVLGFGTRGAELRSYLTTFGDVARRVGDPVPLQAGEPGALAEFSEGYTPIVGWIIDPGAKSPAALETGSFVSMNESILAIISVPAWWTEVRLALKKEWIEGSGSIVLAEPADSSFTNGRRELTVRLPNRPELIDVLLVDSARSGPVISEIDSTAQQTCNEIPLLIVGQRLWRNTAVTIGSVKAQRIEIMPNMGGVVAYFRKPFSASRDDRLRLWTSEGVTEAKLATSISSKTSEGCAVQAPQQ